MKLAGEAGRSSRLKEKSALLLPTPRSLEEEPTLEQTRLFHDLEAAKQKELKIDTSGITDKQYRNSRGANLRRAARYAEQTETGSGLSAAVYRRRRARTSLHRPLPQTLRRGGDESSIWRNQRISED